MEPVKRQVIAQCVTTVNQKGKKKLSPGTEYFEFKFKRQDVSHSLNSFFFPLLLYLLYRDTLCIHTDSS